MQRAVPVEILLVGVGADIEQILDSLGAEPGLGFGVDG